MEGKLRMHGNTEKSAGRLQNSRVQKSGLVLVLNEGTAMLRGKNARNV